MKPQPFLISVPQCILDDFHDPGSSDYTTVDYLDLDGSYHLYLGQVE